MAKKKKAAKKKAAAKRKPAKRKPEPKRAGRPRKLLSPRSRSRFLEMLRDYGGVRGAACRSFGIALHTLLSEEERDPDFRMQTEAIELECNESLEVAAYQLALSGDGAMLRFLLANKIPEKYSRRFQLEHRGHLHVDSNRPLAIVEDADWYGKPGGDPAAAPLVASDPDPALSGPIQGGGLRSEIRQDGPGTDGDSAGARPAAGSVSGSV